MIKKLIKENFLAKVIIAIIIGILIPTISISVSHYLSSSKIIKKNARNTSYQIVKQGADSLSYSLTTGIDMIDLIYSNSRLQEIVLDDVDPDIPVITKELNNRELITYLNSQVYSSSFVKMIYILKKEGMSWGSGDFSPLRLARYSWLDFRWAEEATEKNGGLVWQGLQYDDFSGAGEKSHLVLPVIRVMKDLDTMEDIGYIHVLIDGEKLLQIINQMKLGKTGEFFVVDQKGYMMIDRELDNIHQRVRNAKLYQGIVGSPSFEFEFMMDEVNYYGIKYPLVNNWYLVGIVPIHEITGELVQVQIIIILVALLFTVVAIIIGWIAARKVTDPIKRLTKEMEMVGQGNFTIRASVTSQDEIGRMSKQFNHMISEIEQLMQKVKEEENQKIEVELRAIKHRINPHFLFNTLSTIQWLLQFEQNERAYQALSALSRLLEANMGKQGNFLPVNEEIDIVEKFLEILQIRYDQTFELKVILEEEIEHVQIPRMLLQPIVENSVFHGIVPTGEAGTIVIKGRVIEEDGIYLEVTDDGAGFDTKKLANIHNQEKEESSSYVGIGLMHVFESIRLYYSPKSTVEIESEKSSGTTVKITLFPKDGGETDV